MIVHLINYSADLNSAEYRVTGDIGSACLSIENVPADAAPAAVARLANETCIAQPAGQRRIVSYDSLGRNRFVNLYRG